MATCKENCLHYEACRVTYEELTGDSGTGWNAEDCKCFQDRSKFIELPCKVGDKVYYFGTVGTVYSQTIHQFIYGGTGLKCDSDVMFDSELIGKRFFLTKEQAEQALREREND